MDGAISYPRGPMDRTVSGPGAMDGTVPCPGAVDSAMDGSATHLDPPVLY